MKKGVNTGLFASLGAVTMTADWRIVLSANVKLYLAREETFPQSL